MSYADAVEQHINRSFPPYTDLRRHIDALSANNYAGLQKEFEALGEFERALLQDPSTFYTALQPHNQDRNRWPDILANEATRVRLPMPIGHSDYINANLIDGKPFGLGTKYIAAQAPMAHTVEHWWYMIWSMQVNLIVMLSNPVENGESKVHCYWPHNPGPQAAVRFGPFSIHMSSKGPEPAHPNIIRRVLAVYCDGIPEARTVDMYHFTQWPDHKVPATIEPLLFLLEIVDTYKRSGPILVHCSAGVGRTGVVVTAHAILSLLRKHVQVHGTRTPYPFNVLGTVCYLRRCRNRFIQTVEQLGLTYYLIQQAIERYPSQSRRPPSPTAPHTSNPSSPLSPAHSPTSPSRPSASTPTSHPHSLSSDPQTLMPRGSSPHHPRSGSGTVVLPPDSPAAAAGPMHAGTVLGPGGRQGARTSPARQAERRS